MWFFKSGKGQDPKGHALLEQLKKLYGLEQKAPPESTCLMGNWWESSLAGRTLAFMEHGRGVAVFVGMIEEITEIYLRRQAPGQPVPADARLHLARIVGAAGAELAARFFLAAHPGGDFDYPELRLPPLRDGIPRLSQSVREIAIYEGRQGLSLIIDETAEVESVGADLQLALAMLAVLDLPRTDQS